MRSVVIESDIVSLYARFKENLSLLAGKSVLITGANGFLASYFVDLFTECNKYEEKPMHIFALSKNPVTATSRLGHLRTNPYVTFITADAGKPFQIPPGVDIIVHAASRANPKSFSEDPLDTIDANVNGIRTLLEYARHHSIEHFLFFSTNEVYGNPLPEFIPTPEYYPGNIDCLEERSCYAESKRLAENLCVIFARRYRVPVKILRILLAYGPGMRDDGKVITDFFAKAQRGKRIVFPDKGEAKRSFCYVTDVVDAILKVMFHGTPGEAYNIGNDKENISMRELASIIATIVNNGTVVETNDAVPSKKMYGVNNRHPDITKLRSLRFEPHVPLREGLLRLKTHSEELGIWHHN